MCLEAVLLFQLQILRPTISIRRMLLKPQRNAVLLMLLDLKLYVVWQGHKALQAVADSITLDEVNAIAASILSFASHYGKEKELVADAKARPDKWGPPGPTRATALVACIPMYTDTSGNSTGPLSARAAYIKQALVLTSLT